MAFVSYAHNSYDINYPTLNFKFARFMVHNYHMREARVHLFNSWGLIHI